MKFRILWGIDASIAVVFVYFFVDRVRKEGKEKGTGYFLA